MAADNKVSYSDLQLRSRALPTNKWPSSGFLQTREKETLPVDPALLVLDVDETLVYATKIPNRNDWDFECRDYAVYSRPFLREFLDIVSIHYRLALWSSSSADYLSCIVTHSALSSFAFEFVWSKERCVRVYDTELREYGWTKDLKKIRRRGYSLKRTLVVDDTPFKLERQYGNLIRVGEFKGERDDHELQLLSQYLVSIAGEPNFRQIEKRGWHAAIRS